MNALAAIAAMLATAFHLRRRNQGSRLQRRERSAEIRTAPGWFLSAKSRRSIDEQRRELIEKSPQFQELLAVLK